MSLQRREVWTIGVGAAIVVAVLGFQVLRNGSGGSDLRAADTIRGALDRIEEHDRLKASVLRLAEELKIEVTEENAGDQETKIRQDLAARATAGGLRFSSLRRSDTSSRRVESAVKTIQFRLEVSGRFESVMGLVHGLEEAPIPYLLKELQFESASAQSARGGTPQSGTAGAGRTASPGGGGRGRSGARGNVRATFKIQSYIFPEGLEKPEPVEEEEPESNEEEKSEPDEGEKPESDEEEKSEPDEEEKSEPDGEEDEKPDGEEEKESSPESDAEGRGEGEEQDSSEQ